MPSTWRGWRTSPIRCIENSLHLDLKPPRPTLRQQLSKQEFLRGRGAGGCCGSRAQAMGVRSWGSDPDFAQSNPCSAPWPDCRVLHPHAERPPSPAQPSPALAGWLAGWLAQQQQPTLHKACFSWAPQPLTPPSPGGWGRKRQHCRSAPQKHAKSASSPCPVCVSSSHF